jgi:hypothetical protein
MTTPLEIVAESLETFDRRLSGIESRLVNMESYMAEDAQATEELARSTTKLSELYVALSESVDQIKALLGNYVDETRKQRQQAQRTEEVARGLISEVRAKLP